MADEAIIDIDGNEYETVQIGDQIWSKRNFRATKLNDGTSIQNITDDSDWTTSDPAMCFQDNTTDPDLIEKYGAIYNLNALNTDMLAPEGWRIATKRDWLILIRQMVMDGHSYDAEIPENPYEIDFYNNNVAKALASKDGWDTSDNIGAPGNDPTHNNSVGFDGIGIGYRMYGFNSVGYEGYWWTGSEQECVYIRYSNAYVSDASYPDYFGMPIRLVKDTPTVTVSFVIPEHDDVNVDPISVDVGSTPWLLMPQPPYIGYHKFLGWFKDEAMTIPFDDKNETLDTDITLYGKYEPLELYTVTFETDGGSSVESQEVYEGRSPDLWGLYSTKSGYIFAGWCKDSECNDQWDAFNDVVTDDTTLYAKWLDETVDSIQDLWNLRLAQDGSAILGVDLDFNDDDSYDQTNPDPTRWLDWREFKDSVISGEGWDPGELNIPLDGNNKSIDNLYINRPNTLDIGLFSEIVSDVNDLTLNNVNIIGKSTTGGLSGDIGGSIIVNCNINGIVKTSLLEGETNRETGGLTGFFNGGIIDGCSFRGCVIGDKNVGGLVGYINGPSITNSHANATVKGVNEVGGFAGYCSRDSLIEKCYSTGKVIGSKNVGGFIGINVQNVHDSYSSSLVVGCNYVGGFMGDCRITGPQDPIDVLNCYSTGKVIGVVDNENGSGDPSVIGGFVGETSLDSDESGIRNCYTTGLIEIDASSYDLVGGFKGRENTNGSFDGSFHTNSNFSEDGFYSDTDLTTITPYQDGSWTISDLPADYSGDINPINYPQLAWEFGLTDDTWIIGTGEPYVVFDSNCGSYIEPQLVTIGNPIPQPIPTPVKDGYTFIGWYKDHFFTEEWDDNDVITENKTTLYAKWVESVDCIVTFESNGGSSVNSKTISAGSKIIKPDDPQKENYMFSGWFIDIDLTTPWDFDNDVIESDMTLYAKWVTIQLYTVDFDVNGGTIIDSQIVPENSRIKRPKSPKKIIN